MKKALVIIIVLAIIAGGVYFYVNNQKSNENTTGEENTIANVIETETNEVDVPKSEQTGTAGSNMPLKDNLEEAKYQIEVAMQYLFEDIYGDDVFDARIYVEKVYSAEDEEENSAVKSMNLGPDEVAFEVRYELKPAEGADINKLTIPNGEYDEDSEWITGITRVGVLRPNEKGGEQKYKITDFGTGF